MLAMFVKNSSVVPHELALSIRSDSSEGLAAAEIAVVAAQPKGSLPRAHTCTNESRDLESKQVESSKIASHFLKKKSNLIRFCFFFGFKIHRMFFSLRLQLPSYDSVEELSTKLREAMENVRCSVCQATSHTRT